MEHFELVKNEIIHGRMNFNEMRYHLIPAFFVSGFFVGLSFWVAHADTIGWKNLSGFWHNIFYIEAVLFLVQIAIILFCRVESIFNLKIVSLAITFYLFKLSLEPFLGMAMFFKDAGVYGIYGPFIFLIIVLGFLFHIINLIRIIKELKIRTPKEKNSQKNHRDWYKIGSLLLLVVIVGLILDTGLLGDGELLFGIIISTVTYIGILIGLWDYETTVYLIWRFPEYIKSDLERNKNAK